MRRFDLNVDRTAHCYCDMKESDDGDYVRYEEAEDALEELRQTIEALDMEIEGLYEDMEKEDS